MDEQLELFDVPSPCVGICTSGDHGYCKGCFRTRDERFHWQQFTNTQKSLIIKLCRQRKMKYIRAILLARQKPAVVDQSQGELFDDE